MARDDQPDIDEPEEMKGTDPEAASPLCQRIEDNLQQVRRRLQDGGAFPEEAFASLWDSILPIAMGAVKAFEESVLRSSGLNRTLISREDLISHLREKFKSPKVLQSYDLDNPGRRRVTNYYSIRFRWELSKWLERNVGKLEELEWRKEAKKLRREKIREIKRELDREEHRLRSEERRPSDKETGKRIKKFKINIEGLKQALLMYEQSPAYVQIIRIEDEQFHSDDASQEPIDGASEGVPLAAAPEAEDEQPSNTRRGNASMKDILKTIFGTVDALEGDDQMIIVLSFLYGLNDQKISSEMECSHARIRQRKLRALRNINRRLHEKFPKLVMAAREILKMAREQELLTLTDEDMACVRDETAKEIAHLYFMERKPLPEIAGRLRLEEDKARVLWMSIFRDIVDSRMTRAGGWRQAPLDWDKVGDAELDQLSEPLARYIDCLPYSMRQPHAEGRVRGEAERKTAALFEALKTTADLLYLAYHPLEKARPDLRSLFNERVHALDLQPESVLSKLKLDSDSFDDILKGDRVINAEQAVQLGEALGVDPEDVFSAALATVVENAGA